MTKYQLFIRFLKYNNVLSRYKEELYNRRETPYVVKISEIHTRNIRDILYYSFSFERSIYGALYWYDICDTWIAISEEIEPLTFSEDEMISNLRKHNKLNDKKYIHSLLFKYKL